MVVRLWHKHYGFVLHTGEMWTSEWSGVRYGTFLCDYMSMSVILPLEEVIIDQL